VTRSVFHTGAFALKRGRRARFNRDARPAGKANRRDRLGGPYESLTRELTAAERRELVAGG
jgi:hypothetical protein